MNPIVALFLGFAIKHFVVDFLLQTPYQWKNKGKFGHPGGILHSLLHSVTSLFMLILFVILFPGVFNITVVLPLVVFEFVIHYLMDYTKVNINAYYGWGANTHSEFWYLLGFDQLVHALTYVFMVEWFLL
jgi:hypothetical protein